VERHYPDAFRGTSDWDLLNDGRWKATFADETITTECSPTEEEPSPPLSDFRRRRTLIPDGANIDFAFLGQGCL
jgi:hypothetical protein